MKRTIIALLCVVLATSLFASALAIANRWVESSSGDIAEAIGATFGIPEGAEDISYSMMPDDGLAEMRFTLDGMEYIARIKPSGEFDDISGMYYEWDSEEPCVIAFMQGLVKRVTVEGETMELCLWHDADMGLMYSLATSGADLDGFDITAIAGAIYAQASEVF